MRYNQMIRFQQDLHTIELEDFKYSGTNITGLQLVDLDQVDQLRRDYKRNNFKFSIDPKTFTVRRF